MSANSSPVEEQAIAWTIRVRDADFHDWDVLSEWLASDTAHGNAFQRLTLLDDMLPELFAKSRKQQWHRTIATPFRRPAYQIGAIAAALVAVVSLSLFIAQPSNYSVETAPGQTKLIALSDGSKIALNGDTKITLVKGEPRQAVLDRGEALFTVVHNASNPFIVKVGGALVQDAGTVFNILRIGKNTEVGVSEGLVIFSPQSNRTALKPGQALRADSNGKVTEIFAVSPAAVGGWQRNQLTYNNATIERVASDLTRSLGTNISAEQRVKALRFTGTINLNKNLGQFFADAAPVLGVSAKRTDDGWILAGGDEAGH